MKRNGWMTGLLLALCVAALAIAPGGRAEQTSKGADITRQCAFRVSEGDKDRFLDGQAGTIWTAKHEGAWVGVKLPQDAQPGWLRVEWLFDPTAYELTEYDADMAPLRTRTQDDMWPNIYSMYPLLPGTRVIQLKLTAKDQSICRIGVYSAGELPAEAQLWNPPVDKADLMVLSTHQDDELIFMGGTIPYYATALKKPTVVVYMTNCARYRRAEALNALWKMGVRDYPDFINLQDEKVGSVEAGIQLWGGADNILSLVVERIRRYKPEVIVTQDLNGEYGHNQHKVTARCAKYAIDAAADPTRYPQSAEMYGVWQVKKLYHHLYAENEIEMDWETPMDALGGKTPLEVAKLGMKEHSSQTRDYTVKSHGTYDNARFGLYFTTVGEDVARNDFLENIDPDASARYLAEHAGEIAAQKAAAAAARAADGVSGPDEAGDEASGEDADPPPETAAGEAPEEATAELTGDGADAVAEAATEPPEDEGGQDEAATDAADDTAEEAADEGSGVPGNDATADAGDAVPGRPGVQAAGQLLAPTAGVANERGGSVILPIAMVGAGVAAIGVGGWFGWRYMRSQRRRRRRRR